MLLGAWSEGVWCGDRKGVGEGGGGKGEGAEACGTDVCGKEILSD